MRRAQALGEAAGLDAETAEVGAGRLVPGPTTLARAARDAVHHRHPRAVLELSRDLVPEHGPALAACPNF